MMMQEHLIDAGPAGGPGSGSPLRNGPLSSMTAMVGAAAEGLHHHHHHHHPGHPGHPGSHAAAAAAAHAAHMQQMHQQHGHPGGHPGHPQFHAQVGHRPAPYDLHAAAVAAAAATNQDHLMRHENSVSGGSAASTASSGAASDASSSLAGLHWTPHGGPPPHPFDMGQHEAAAAAAAQQQQKQHQMLLNKIEYAPMEMLGVHPHGVPHQLMAHMQPPGPPHPIGGMEGGPAPSSPPKGKKSKTSQANNNISPPAIGGGPDPLGGLEGGLPTPGSASDEQMSPNSTGGNGANGGKGAKGGSTATRRNAWGNLSYADLITQAITSSPEKRLTLSQVYEWMVVNIPYFKDKGDSNSSAGWKNSIRHNLSLHSRFVRVQNEGTGKSSWWMLNPDAKAGTTCKSSRRRTPSMEGGASMNGGPIPGTSGGAGRSPGDPGGKKRGRSKKSATATSGGPPYRNGGKGGGPPVGPPGMYDMGPDSPGGSKARHLSGFPYDLKGQPVPTPLYQDFAGGGRLSPPRMDNGFGGPPGGGPPYPGHPGHDGAWPPPEYQTIVPDYFPGPAGSRPYGDQPCSEGDYSGHRPGSPGGGGGMYHRPADQNGANGNYSFQPPSFHPSAGPEGFNHFGAPAETHKLPSSPLDMPGMADRQQFSSQVLSSDLGPPPSMSPAAAAAAGPPPKTQNNELKPGFESPALNIKEEMSSGLGPVDEKPSSILERALVKEEQPNDLSSSGSNAAAASSDSWAPESVIERHDDHPMGGGGPNADSSRQAQLNFFQQSHFESHHSAAAGSSHSPVHPSFATAAATQDSWMR